MGQHSLRRDEAELEQSSTEQILESARHLDRLSVEEMLELIHREDGEAWKAVGAELPRVGQAVDILAEVVGAGGRWFNVGAMCFNSTSFFNRAALMNSSLDLCPKVENNSFLVTSGD